MCVNVLFFFVLGGGVVCVRVCVFFVCFFAYSPSTSPVFQWLVSAQDQSPKHFHLSTTTTTVGVTTPGP